MENEYSQNGQYIFRKLSKTNFVFLKKGGNPMKIKYELECLGDTL